MTDEIHGWHASQSQHNKNCSCGIAVKLQNAYPDWEMTTLSCSALHIINEYFVQNNIPKPRNHLQSGKLIKKDLSQIDLECQKLYDMSIKARYQSSCIRITPNDVQRPTASIKYYHMSAQSFDQRAWAHAKMTRRPTQNGSLRCGIKTKLHPSPAGSGSSSAAFKILAAPLRKRVAGHPSCP